LFESSGMAGSIHSCSAASAGSAMPGSICSMHSSQQKAVSYHNAVAYCRCSCKQQHVPAVSRLLSAKCYAVISCVSAPCGLKQLSYICQPSIVRWAAAGQHGARLQQSAVAASRLLDVPSLGICNAHASKGSMSSSPDSET
jgi:hypothetical protein